MERKAKKINVNPGFDANAQVESQINVEKVVNEIPGVNIKVEPLQINIKKLKIQIQNQM